MKQWKHGTVDRTVGWLVQYPENYPDQKYKTVNKNQARCLVVCFAAS
jgi:hypothetical protein